MSTPITLMFTDMVGSSAAKRAASLGPDASSRDRAYLAGIQSKHLHLVREAVAEYSGREIMTIGDSFFLTFEDPIQAVRCAAAIQRRLHTERIQTPGGPLRLRIGIHIGTPEFFENSWHGTAVDTAARVESAAAAEQIIITDVVRTTVGKLEEMRFRKLGTFSLKGVGNHVLWDVDYSRHGRRLAALPTNEQKRRARIYVFMVVFFLSVVGAWVVKTYSGMRQHDNVSVLVADFKNKTTDPVFDNILEQPVGIALEGAPFINIIGRNQAKKVAKEMGASGNTLDENSARLIAHREGIPYVVSGAIERDGPAYRLTAYAVDPISGRQIGANSTTVNAREDVLKSVPRVISTIRTALGDTTPKSAQLSAAETYTAGSLEAAKFYADGQDLQWSGKWDEATKAYKEALALDPQMGRAYSGLAVIAFNSGNRSSANQYFGQAMANIGRMSERERYRTRGLYYLDQRDVEKAIEEYTQLLKKYPADSAGHANLALAYFYDREMSLALQEGMKAVALSPNNVPQRNNVGLYAMYSGDFALATTQQDAVLALNPKFNLAYSGKAMSLLAQGSKAQAAITWETLAKINAHGASGAALGLADLALYEGRIDDALEILGKGAAEDLAAKNNDEAAEKFATIAYAHVSRHEDRPAMAAADRALSLSEEDNIRVLASQVYVEAGATAKAKVIATKLSAKLENDSRAYAKLINGLILLKSGKVVAAIGEMREAQKIADSWLAHFYLGRAYLEAKAYAEADSEFDACQRRMGEATAVFLDEEPTCHLLPLVSYYDGVAREGLHSPSAKESFQTFLYARSQSQRDPLVADALRRR